MTAAFRWDPKGTPDQYKTYAIRAMLRKGSCISAGCEAYENGWQLRVEDLSPEMLHTAKTSGRRYKEIEVDANNHLLIFEAGQPCFKDGFHMINMIGEERYFVGPGDHRRFSVNRAQARTADTFVDDMATHLDKVNDFLNKG